MILINLILIEKSVMKILQRERFSYINRRGSCPATPLKHMGVPLITFRSDTRATQGVTELHRTLHKVRGTCITELSMGPYFNCVMARQPSDPAHDQ